MIGAVTSITLLISLAALHLYWAAGGRAGKSLAVPESNGRPMFKPGSLATLLVALGLLMAAAIIATQAGLIFPQALHPASRVLTGIIALVFLMRAVGDFRYVGFFKKVEGTRFAKLDTWVFSPLCVLLAAATLDAAVKLA